MSGLYRGASADYTRDKFGIGESIAEFRNIRYSLPGDLAEQIAGTTLPVIRQINPKSYPAGISAQTLQNGGSGRHQGYVCCLCGAQDFGLKNSSVATGLSGSGGFFGGVNRRLHITRLSLAGEPGDNPQTYGGGRQYGSKNRREECVWVLCRPLPKGSAARRRRASRNPAAPRNAVSPWEAGGRPAERRFRVGGSGKSVARCHRTVLAYWKFESISLQR